MTTKTATLDVRRAFMKARARTDTLFACLRPEALYDRPVAERHRNVFYVGHLEAFDWNLLREPAGLAAFEPEFDQLFAFGIDPEPGQLPQDQPSDWPAIRHVQDYNQRVRNALDTAVDRVPEEMLHVALEHRLMHAETFAYLLHDVPVGRKTIADGFGVVSGSALTPTSIDIPEGTASLGQRRHGDHGRFAFGWDNEFDGHDVSVPAFAIARYKVTNGEYLRFVEAGAEPPRFWSKRDGQWYWRAMAGEVPLPMDWPVYVTYQEAAAYAQWSGKRLPTEAEFHRAAYGTPDGAERQYPWGDDPPDRSRGNFDDQRWDPIPVTASPAGDSAFGVSQLVGNGWEWTSTVFHPFQGFEPFPFYPGYSARFFDGDHFVLKGASARTPAELLRRSFRNWFRSTYPYVYAGFRCVEK